MNVHQREKTITPDNYVCDICQKIFTRKFTRDRHRKTHFKEGDDKIIGNLKNYYSKSKSHTDVNTVNSENMHIEEELTKSSDDVKIPEKPVKLDDSVNPENIFIEEEVSQSADNVKILERPIKSIHKSINGAVQTINLLITKDDIDPIVALNNRSEEISSILRNSLKKMKSIKWYICVHVEFIRFLVDGSKQTIAPHFNGKCRIETNEDGIDSNFREALAKILDSHNRFQREGSAWILKRVLEISLNIANYQPLSSGSYMKLPNVLKKTKSIVNVINDDDKCFIYAILSALHSNIANPTVQDSYLPYINELNYVGLNFPMRVCDIAKFEKMNGISINIFAYDEDIFPLQITKLRYDRHINLMMISNGVDHHFCWIKSMSALLAKQRGKEHARYYCDYCLHGFFRENLLLKHVDLCKRFGVQLTVLPNEENKYMKYKEISKELKVPFVVYADFECILEDIDCCQNNSNKSFTDKKSLHVPCGFAYKVVAYDDNLSEEVVTYRGVDSAKVFIKHMLNLNERLGEILMTPKIIIISDLEEQNFKDAKLCHICEQDLLDDRVRDHCHLTGSYRGAAHNQCNILFRVAKFIPVIMHNLKKYDGHLIIAAMNANIRKINCIPMNMENYLSFSMNKMRFIDSLQFLSASLSSLVDNLCQDGDMSKFKNTRTFIEHKYSKSIDIKLNLLTRKGIYPYEYMNCFDKFEDTTLPNIDQFYSKLKMSGISNEDHIHGMNVWKEFNIRNMGEYHDLYVATDVTLLADVFEKFREMCMQYYKLDAAHFYSLPGLSWSACMKMTKIELELLTDIDQHIFIESGIRGGISVIVTRYARANNTYLPNYDSMRASNYIQYLDCNNLYGTAMKLPLPINNFKWLSEAEINTLDILQIADDNEKGYILEVDLEYPAELHALHNDLPLAPEKQCINEEQLSAYQNELKEQVNWIPSAKLIGNLQSKQNYIIHYVNLKLYLSLGLILKKVHRVLSFNQSAWMWEYISFNTAQRQAAKNNFEKDFFKLLINSIYGKSLQNDRKHVNVELINKEKRLLKVIANPCFQSFKIFNEDICATLCTKKKLLLNKPIYVGFSILELSKTIMYEFHYNHIKQKYGNLAKLLFTDTDSLCYQIYTDDIYADMKMDEKLYDFSNYPSNHKLYSKVNLKVLGKFKDETGSIPIAEFVGLRAKMYSLLYNNIEKKVAKGIGRAVIKYDLNHEMYKDTLFRRCIKRNAMQMFRSYNQKIYTVTLNKVSLCPFDDKRYILKNGIDTLAYGNCNI